LVKDENSNLLADSHSILNWLLNVHGVNDVRQTEIHTAEPLVPEPISFEVDIAIERFKSHQVLIEFWQNRSKQQIIRYVPRSTNLLIPFGMRKNCQNSGMNRL
jgi:hypothetical protein